MALRRRAPCNTHLCRMHTNRQPRSTRSARQRATPRHYGNHTTCNGANSASVGYSWRTGRALRQRRRALMCCSRITITKPLCLHLGLAHICAGTATSAPWTRPHRRQDCHVCTLDWPTSAADSKLRLWGTRGTHGRRARRSCRHVPCRTAQSRRGRRHCPVRTMEHQPRTTGSSF
jgi:hypothetical protein